MVGDTGQFRRSDEVFGELITLSGARNLGLHAQRCGGGAKLVLRNVAAAESVEGEVVERKTAGRSHEIGTAFTDRVFGSRVEVGHGDSVPADS